MSRNKHTCSFHNSLAVTVAPLLYVSALTASSWIPSIFLRDVTLFGMFLWPVFPRQRLKQLLTQGPHIVPRTSPAAGGGVKLVSGTVP